MAKKESAEEAAKQNEALIKKHKMIAYCSHKVMCIWVLLSYCDLIPRHIEQTKDGFAKGDFQDAARAGVESCFEIVGVLATLLDYSLLGGGIIIGNLSGWGGFIHLVLIGDKFTSLGGMWMQVLVGMAFVLTDPWSSRPFSQLILICIAVMPLATAVLLATWTVAGLLSGQGADL
mmetsp:Transcript_5612/g.6127  ORF Transcript_5612/g.6127 Transcript_5612/m.6127 type:complete len:175 (+) Transcript_5612:100-624(+)